MSNLTQQAVAYIGLGSNIGIREMMLEHAVKLLQEHPEVEVLRCSNVYETDPVGFVDQPPFLNMAAAVRTTLSPLALLETCLHVERELGRRRDVRWGPRTIDLDVLLYDEMVRDDEVLTLPHPRMQERLFVLVPLLEILPPSGANFELYSSALDTMEGKEGVTLWKRTAWPNGSGLFAN